MSTRVVMALMMAAAVVFGQPAWAQNRHVLRVGAARVDVTPSADNLPAHYGGVLDRVYARAIVVDNGDSQLALVTVDVISLGDEAFSRVSAAIESATGIPRDHQLIAGTGTHSVPIGGPAAGGPSAAAAVLERRIVEAVVDARSRLRPAAMTFGQGQSWINVQRDRIDPATRRWWEGPDYDGPSDKSVSVLAFNDLTGRPIAAYYNYGVFNVVTGMLDLVSGDISGAASRYIEDATGDDFVAAFALGAHGDQNPIFFNQTFELRERRIEAYAARGEDIRIAMPPPGGTGLDRSDPVVARLMDQQKQVNAALGLMLGEEVLRVMRDAPDGVTDADIHVARGETQCPGRVRTNQGRGGVAGTYEDADPVTVRYGLTLIGDVAIGSVNGAPYSEIGSRLKRESPFTRTMLLTRANGYVGYMPSDAAYGHETFAVLNTRLKPGCAETAIVDGVLGLVPTLRY
ncbi:neutral/alkaline non-lysosomal ceramidase N-terminal domain-containing protein [Brevundimonas sp. NPDC092305]|uniref:neutral/alkaline non-lysosomal ceramidase N-terminal domain-containing protein n=1 Tax=Brevundimonas sp. NPDC092305 TaxID=3363957 RepID=UPI0038075B24